MTQQAVQIVNFSHNTTLSLQYPPQTLGLGCLYFVFKHLNCEVRSGCLLLYSSFVKQAGRARLSCSMSTCRQEIAMLCLRAVLMDYFAVQPMWEGEAMVGGRRSERARAGGHPAADHGAAQPAGISGRC